MLIVLPLVGALVLALAPRPVARLATRAAVLWTLPGALFLIAAAWFGGAAHGAFAVRWLERLPGGGGLVLSIWNLVPALLVGLAAPLALAVPEPREKTPARAAFLLVLAAANLGRDPRRRARRGGGRVARRRVGALLPARRGRRRERGAGGGRAVRAARASPARACSPPHSRPRSCRCSLVAGVDPARRAADRTACTRARSSSCRPARFCSSWSASPSPASRAARDGVAALARAARRRG